MRPIVLAAILMAASPALAQPHLQSNMKVHHVVIQIDQDDPAVMNLALNNADNMKKSYEDKGEKVEIEFVAFGAGLAMMRSDKSPVKERLAAMSQRGVVFSGCANTKANQSRMENQTITLLPGTREVATGVVRIIELEEKGWTYLRP
jgi:uncharacterized protein